MSVLFYQVHVEVDSEHEVEWLEYMERHIPEVLETGCFDGATIHRKEEDPCSFVISYQTSNDRFSTYNQDFAGDLKADHVHQFGDKVRAYRELWAPIKMY